MRYFLYCSAYWTWKRFIILSREGVWLQMEFGLVIGITDHLQLITISNYTALNNPCARLLNTAHNKSSQFVFTSCFLVTILRMPSAYVLTGWRMSHNWFIAPIVQLSANRPCYNISARPAQKTPFLCCCSIASMGTCLFEKPLLSNGCCISA
jgi:hypothetical protein